MTAIDYATEQVTCPRCKQPFPAPRHGNAAGQLAAILRHAQQHHPEWIVPDLTVTPEVTKGDGSHGTYYAVSLPGPLKVAVVWLKPDGTLIPGQIITRTAWDGLDIGKRDRLVTDAVGAYLDTEEADL